MGEDRVVKIVSAGVGVSYDTVVLILLEHYLSYCEIILLGSFTSVCF